MLRAYARLSPTQQDRDLAGTARDDLFVFDQRHASELEQLIKPWGFRDSLGLSHTPRLARLASVDALHREELLLRLCWVFVAGTAMVDGSERRVLQPLVLRPVRLVRRSALTRVAGGIGSELIGLGSASEYLLEVAGDPEVSPLIDDPGAREHILSSVEFGGGALNVGDVTPALIRRLPKLNAWTKSAADAAGLVGARLVVPTVDPVSRSTQPGLAAIPRFGLIVTRSVDRPSVQGALLDWAGRRGLDGTALAHVVHPGDPGSGVDRHAEVTSVESPLPLTPSQARVVHSSRTEPLTVVSGAPGTGKTHAICAVALDAVERRESVLIATRSRYAAEVVAELLDRTPGPDPVRFGDGVAMSRLIDELSDRMQTPLPGAELAQLTDDVTRTRAVASSLEQQVRRRLELESLAATADDWDAAVPALAASAPRIFDPSSDLEAIEALLTACDSDETDGRAGFFERRRERRRRRELAALTGATVGDGPMGSDGLSAVRTALDAARSRRAAAELAAFGDRTELPWAALVDARAEVRTALGRRLAALPMSADRLDAAARSSVGQLINALRAGRGRRRQLLAALAPGQLTAGAPLWIGTLSDIEDVLPAVSGLFDLVVLDEASQIDQPQAAPALLRGRRAVVVGDPHQLRHVSFRSDADIDAALAEEGLADLRPWLDVRRVSAFDLAAMAAPVRVLRDHFRSVPHLIDFSAQRFYRDRLAVMTRTPATERLDAVDVTHLDHPSEKGQDADRVVPAEVDAVLDLVERSGRVGDGAPPPTSVADLPSMGVITPFRAQADALESALVERIDGRTIDALRLRVGTVHAFQGGERDHVVIATGLTDEDTPNRRRFLEDPNLFNVMVTRGRDRVTVVTGYTGTSGLLADYVSWGDGPPAPPTDAESDPGWADPWTAELAGELRRAGLAIRVGYPVGPWHIDIVVDDPDAPTPMAIMTRVGTDAAAHMEQRLTLIEMGWRTLDAFPTRWSGDAARASIDLVAEIRP